MARTFAGHEIPPDVHLHMLDGKTFEEMVESLPVRPKADVEFGLLVLSRHPLFEPLSRMMTIGALQKGTSKAILDAIQAHEMAVQAESEVDPGLLPFLKECHALCVEFHVRAVAEYQDKHRSPGDN